MSLVNPPGPGSDRGSKAGMDAAAFPGAGHLGGDRVWTTAMLTTGRCVKKQGKITEKHGLLWLKHMGISGISVFFVVRTLCVYIYI